MFDTHAHLADPAFDADLEAVIENARGVGVDHILAVGYDLASCRTTLAMTGKYPRLYAAVGLHPHEAGKSDQDWHEITRLGKELKVVAIGETGLDYFRNYAPAAAQRSLFQRHIELARQLGKPLVIHTRASFDDALGILVEAGYHRGVFHCYSGDTDFARKVLELGYYLSFSGSLTFPDRRLDAVLEMMPRERILIETDAPYLTPVPFRGKRNEPAYVRHVAQRAGQILGLSLDEIAALTTENGCRLFGIKAPLARTRPA